MAICGPAGLYLGYLLGFVFLPARANDYQLAVRYTEPVLWMTGIAFVVSAIHSFRVLTRHVPTQPVRSGIRDRDYLLIHGACIVLTFLAVATVARTRGFGLVFEDYGVFYALVRNGASRYIYLVILLLFCCIFDLYSSRITVRGAVRFLSLLPYFLFFGSRTFAIVMVCTVMYLVIARLDVDRLSVARFAAVGSLVLLSVVVLNDTRSSSADPAGPDLDLDAAFILEDVIRAVGDGTHRPSMQSLEDFRWQFVPFGLDDARPRSTAETRAIYPEVASRGTGSNITFPLSANLYFNLGPFYLWLIPLVLLVAQAGFVRSLANRDQRSYLGFMGFMGAVFFVVIARGGIINSRLLIPVVLATMAFVGGRLVLAASEPES